MPIAASNPVLIARALSESTESWDRGGEFAHCRRLASLQHDLLISQHAHPIELFTRTQGKEWTLMEYGPGEIVPLAALGLQLPVDEWYADRPGTTSG